MCVLPINLGGFSTPPLDDSDDTWPFPALITSPVDSAQHHALYILLSMILLISTTDSDNAPKSKEHHKLTGRSPQDPPPSPSTPSIGVCLWRASTLDSSGHLRSIFTCTALLGWD